jgi:hypothetical protein
VGIDVLVGVGRGVCEGISDGTSEGVLTRVTVGITEGESAQLTRNIKRISSVNILWKFI